MTNIDDQKAFEHLDSELMALAKQYGVDVVDQELQVGSNLALLMHLCLTLHLPYIHCFSL